MALCAAFLAACGAGSAPDIALDTTDLRQPLVVVTGLSRADLAVLERADLSRDGWTSLLRVGVSAGAAPVAGRYAIKDGAVRFVPMFPLDSGRSYTVVFDPALVPGGHLQAHTKVTRVLSVPGAAQASSTKVAAVYPGGDQVPANLLRMYVEFSGEMGSRAGQDYVAVLGADGHEIPGALLPLDTGLWNRGHTRFTVLFDPGRVKRGILPNRSMGRPLAAGGSFVLVVRREWPDAHGMPLAAEFRKAYRVGPPIERPLSTADWRLTPPATGTRDPLVVSFGAALDRGLLGHALRVTRGAVDIEGEAVIGGTEMEWRFTPRDPWQRGDHALVALPELEDMAGNRVGHAFEARGSETDDALARPARVPFKIR